MSHCVSTIRAAENELAAGQESGIGAAVEVKDAVEVFGDVHATVGRRAAGVGWSVRRRGEVRGAAGDLWSTREPGVADAVEIVVGVRAAVAVVITVDVLGRCATG